MIARRVKYARWCGPWSAWRPAVRKFDEFAFWPRAQHGQTRPPACASRRRRGGAAAQRDARDLGCDGRSGGWLYAHYITYLSPKSLDTQTSISALLMASLAAGSSSDRFRNRIPRHSGSSFAGARTSGDVLWRRADLHSDFRADRIARIVPASVGKAPRPSRFPPHHQRGHGQTGGSAVTGVLAASGIRMSFGGLTALKGGAIEVAAGAIVGLIGRNGSGKSTLFNCITGYFRPQAGKITAGREITGVQPHRIVEHGIVRTFQTPRLDFDANVHAAVLCGFYPARCLDLSGRACRPAGRAPRGAQAGRESGSPHRAARARRAARPAARHAVDGPGPAGRSCTLSCGRCEVRVAG